MDLSLIKRFFVFFMFLSLPAKAVFFESDLDLKHFSKRSELNHLKHKKEYNKKRDQALKNRKAKLKKQNQKIQNKEKAYLLDFISNVDNFSTQKEIKSLSNEEKSYLKWEGSQEEFDQIRKNAFSKYKKANDFYQNKQKQILSVRLKKLKLYRQSKK